MNKINYMAVLGLSAILFTGCNDNLDIPIPAERDVAFFESVKDDAVNEFLNFAKVPRPGFHLDKARDYLKVWADSYGYVWHRDEYGNCWFDVPVCTAAES